MKELLYTIKTLSPVILAEKNINSTLYSTKKYIPGSAFRGVLANKFIRNRHKDIDLKNIHKDDDFYTLFLSGNVKFLPAYPINGDMVDDYRNYTPFILPFSIMKEKTTGKVVDISLDKSVFKPGLKKLRGFAVTDKSKTNNIYTVSIDTQIELHMSRINSRISGSSKDGEIFNYEYIEPYQFFRGCIIIDDDVKELTIKCLESLISEKDNIIYIGHAKNAQYGKCECVSQCVNNINVNALEAYGNLSLYLYAYTPYIPFEEWNYCKDCCEKKEDKDENNVYENLYNVNDIINDLCETISCKIDVNDMKLIQFDKSSEKKSLFVETEEISGYMNVWNAKQERKIALSAGSLIPIIVKKEKYHDLEKVLYKGFGCRTAEGYGQFRIWKSRENLSDELKKKNNKFSESISIETIKVQAEEILKSYVMDAIKNQAEKDAKLTKLKDVENENIAKHIFSRLEEYFINPKLSSSEICKNIQGFNEIAKNNLREIIIKVKIDDKNIKRTNRNLYEILSNMEILNSKEIGLIYNNDIRSILKEVISETTIKKLAGDFGDNIIDMGVKDKENLCKQYWYWFMRHMRN